MPIGAHEAWAARGFGPALLPIIPPLVRLSPGSTVPLEQRGKVPGVMGAGGAWHSFAWREAPPPTAADLKAWGAMGASVGLRAALFPALDIDVLDAAAAEAIEALAHRTMGLAPARYGRAPKRLLPYRLRAGERIVKRRVKFRLPGMPAEANPYAVEILGDGQQYVVAGTHPSTRQPYAWPQGEPMAAALPEIGVAEVDAFFADLALLLDMLGAEEVKATTGHAEREEVDQATLRAPSAEALREAVAAIPNRGDRDGWIRMGHAIKAAADGVLDDADAIALWEEWSNRWDGPEEDPDDLARRWAGFRPPFVVGWPWIDLQARGAGWVGSAQLDFAGVQAPAPAAATTGTGAGGGEGEAIGPATRTLQERAFARYRWIEAVKRIGDLETGALLDKEQFNVRNSWWGPPLSQTKSAAAKFLADPRLVRLDGLTFLPGAPREVDEPGIGRCFNRWRPSALVPRRGATEADVRPWLDHLEMLVPMKDEREHVLHVMAHLLQKPGVKINQALVFGGLPGIGKDTLWAPVIQGIGPHNVRAISVADLLAPQNDWAAGVQLVIINEMHSDSRVMLVERMKPYIASPPEYLRINTKNVPQYDLPNRICVVVFTNRRDAIAIERGDRRYCVIWSECGPREQSYYRRLWAWFGEGGAAAVVGWLLGRDISAFDPAGRAPETAAKAEMAMDSRSDLQAAIEDAIEAGEWPDLWNPEDIARRLNQAAGARGRGFSARGVAVVLRQIGARPVNGHGGPGAGSGMVRLPVPIRSTGAVRARLWSVRNHERYAPGAMPPAALARLFCVEWARVDGTELSEADLRSHLGTPVTHDVTHAEGLL